MDTFQKFLNDKGISSNKIHSYASYVNPTIIEERKLNTASMDVFSRLMMDRIIFIGTVIDSEMANILQAQLLYLASENPDEKISIYINTPGGEVEAGLLIYDTMQLIKPSIKTICTGWAASMGSVLLAAGDQRAILPHGKVMIHQPWGSAGGSASDILIEAKEIEKTREELCKILSLHTGQDYEKIFTDCDRDYWMNAQEAVNYHIVDQILIKNDRSE